MSSPSSPKRKRNTAIAPGNDTAGTASADHSEVAAGTKHKKSEASVDSSNPPPKRARKEASEQGKMSSNGVVVPTIQKETQETQEAESTAADLDKTTSKEEEIKESEPIEKPAKAGIVGKNWH